MEKTLCWDCAKATGGCSWSNHGDHTPVPGWTAVDTKVRMNNNQYAPSFIVIECPEFERDAYDGGLHRLWRNGK